MLSDTIADGMAIDRPVAGVIGLPERFAGLDVATVFTGSNLHPALRAELVLG